MPVQHLLPFALPTGRDGNTGRLTVYFSPRLKEAGVLSDYSEWLDWPATLDGPNLSLVVEVNGSGVPATHRVVSVTPRSDLWTAVFGQDMPVIAHRFLDFSAAPPVQPMASGDFSESVLDLYLGMARSHPNGPPNGDDLLALAAAAGLAMDGDTGSGSGSLAEAAAYRAPMNDQGGEDTTGPRFDFHGSVSLLGHHPELLRHLGLAVDLEVDLSATPTPTRVRVSTGFAGNGRFEIDLETRTTPAFLALPNANPDNNEQTGGFLTLATEKAFLSIVDPHLAGSRLTAAAELASDHDDGTLPALATRALTLVRPDVTNVFKNRTERQAELQLALEANLTGGPNVTLFAEDLTIGQRIDVLDRREWRSLFQRQSDTGYVFPRLVDITVVPEPDEGWNTLLLVTEQDDARERVDPERDAERPAATYRLDDAMYRWDGWSGAAPPPSSTLEGTNGRAVAKDANQPVEDDIEAAQVAVDYRVVPKSLPRLRFGRSYRMRARAVDLAGNSQTLSTRSPAGSVVGPEPFGRLEPIAAPTVIRRSARPIPGVGDTPFELVLRSDPDDADESVSSVDRLLFPGRVGQDLCELHGLPKDGVNPGSYLELATRDALDLTDQTVVEPATGELVAGSIKIRDGAIVPGPTRQDVSYLSDPAIGGVRFGFPTLGSDVGVPVAGEWPARQSVRLVVVAGDDEAEVAPDAETDLRVSVPKAEIVPVDASFAIDESFLDDFGLWQRFSPEEQAEMASIVGGGAHWMFTPARSLKLVHAVRRPMTDPAVAKFNEPDRVLGSSAVVLGGILSVHDKSTERVTLTAGWTDTVDDPDEGPVPRSTRVELCDLLVPRGDGSNELLFEGLRSELHDTKRHLAAVDLEAFSSFASYFTEERTLTVGDEPIELGGEEGEEGVVAGTVEVTVPVTREKAVAGVDFIVDGTSNTILFVTGGVFADGDRATVRYVPRPISRTSAESFAVLFRNTAVPPPPSVAEVIPAFARGEDGAHSGQVLRVYLERPWLVTGDGEQLAVVLDQPSIVPPGLTVVGRDPILPGGLGTGPVAGPTAADFPRAVTEAGRVDGVHDVAGHEVTFDVQSGRWFADIELAPSFGYRPFVRLTVARYQPDSIDGAFLSSFVTLEPVRVGVVRTTSVTRVADTAQVKVRGLDGLGNAVQVTVQAVDGAVADADLRWRAAGDPVRLVSSIDADGETTWAGSVDLPSTAAPLRVLVEELEPGRQGVDRVFTAVETVVYVEAVELIPA